MDTQFPFDDLKILDFTNEVGAYSTKLFADLGAEVVKVEPRDGDSTRKLSPFYHNEQDDEKSLYYFYLNTNKKSIVLDIESSFGQEAVKRLVNDYDIIIENFKPGYMSSLGLGYEELKKINPKLIYTSITPFGQKGPYKDYIATDIVSVAMGGLMQLGGYPDTSPIAPYGNQAYYASSLFAAVGTLLAIYHRDLQQIGQYVDVSMQEAVAMGLENAAQFYDLEGTVRTRKGAEFNQAGWGLYPCSDGLVYIMTASLSSSGGWENLVRWLIDEKVTGAEALLDTKWKDAEWRSTEEAKVQFYKIFKNFAANKTKLEIYEKGQQRKVPVCPVSELDDVLENPQLIARDFFKELHHKDLGSKVTYAGPPYLFTAMEWSLRNPAPKKGEQTETILLKAGFTEEEISTNIEGGLLYGSTSFARY